MEKKVNDIIENLESKILDIKNLQKTETDYPKLKEMQGMIDGFEYSVEKIKTLLPRKITKKDIIAIIIAYALGTILALLLPTINFN